MKISGYYALCETNSNTFHSHSLPCKNIMYECEKYSIKTIKCINTFEESFVHVDPRRIVENGLKMISIVLPLVQVEILLHFLVNNQIGVQENGFFAQVF